jgi:hypothetical protein
MNKFNATKPNNVIKINFPKAFIGKGFFFDFGDGWVN